jgi:hypothetical protein
MAYASEANILGYGGGSGGGKTDLLLGLAVTQHRRAIIFRREHTEARDMFARCQEIIEKANVVARLNRALSTIHLEATDRLLELGGIRNPEDWRKQRGRARDLFGFDEATEFEELMVRSLLAWNRTTIPGQRCRYVLGFNPPSLKRGQWLRQFFGPWLDSKHPNPAEYGELRWFTTINGQDVECPNGEPFATGETDPNTGKPEIAQPLSRTFIRALLDDNAYLRDTNYRAGLQALPGTLRAQLLYGDMDAEDFDDAFQVIPTKWVQLAQERWSIDGHNGGALSALGSDPAHGGHDENVGVARVGTWFSEPVAKPGHETPHGRDTIVMLAKLAQQFPSAGKEVPIGMDVCGVGEAVGAIAEDMELLLVGLDGSKPAPDKATDRSGLLAFFNMRAYMWWRFREALDPENGENLALPPDRDLLVDLCSAHYEVGPRGIKIEAKEHIKKRIGRSPGKGEGVIYAYMARPQVIGYQTVETRSHGAESVSGAMTSKWKQQRGF